MEDTHHFQLGGFRCLAVNDGGLSGRASALFTNAPEDALQAALTRHELTADALPSPWTCLLMDTGSQRVLIDTGENNAGNLGGGRLVPRLRAAGISPESVDVVFLTHGHGDHIGGNVDAQGRATFPNARYVMGRTEWEYWTAEANLATMSTWAARLVRRCLLPLAGRVTLVEPGSEIAPGIRAVDAPGHTVGHLAVEIVSGSERLLHVADAFLHPIHLEHPDWMAAYDADAAQTVETRRALCRRAVASDALVLAFHFDPFPGLGRIVADGAAWRWVPLP